jgi:hypothetical protein
MVRLCVRGLQREQIAGYLDALEWEGPRGELETILGSFGQEVGQTDLDLDVCDRLLPKIGLECHLTKEPSRFRQFLARLVSGKLCTVGKARALESWGGIAYEGLLPGTWPQNLSVAARLVNHRLQSIFARRFHHVKIICLPGGPLEAKAYLAVYQKWVTPKELRDFLLTDTMI